LVPVALHSLVVALANSGPDVRYQYPVHLVSLSLAGWLYFGVPRTGAAGASGTEGGPGGTSKVALDSSKTHGPVSGLMRNRSIVSPTQIVAVLSPGNAPR